MQHPDLYRRRYIPNQTNCLKDDTVFLYEPGRIVTGWTTIRPRADIARGLSLYCMEEGWKISKMFHRDGHLVYWYIDIIEPEVREEENSVIFHDLLLDVVIYPDGDVKLLDLDELGDAIDRHLIPEDYAVKALRRADALLRTIRRGELAPLQRFLETFE
ncbi:MAG: DUF402 domain-containing protein [Lachnospiraceae bacterium]|nr:DUF402 domain-containing protein [Lachnospiraceae bacterium]MBQ9561923.1 DUF402 domain-containing protein [Lachnospiraceae bacterium]MBQ9592975.1 DUF402 domain-containing protein [Lachnospiraceae bacterium]